MTAVKICGLTRAEDAMAAAEYGADFVGFVLWSKSPRATTIERVREIVKALPDAVEPVGVFVNPSAGDVNGAIDAGIRIAQIHGEVPEVDVRVIRAVHLAGDGIEPDITDGTVLLDAHDPVQHGGTGKTIDWQRAAAVARSRRIILAGGLKPSNVREAIAQVKPWAVDVASGVETSPGIKDHSLIQAFIRNAKESL